jgi:peptide/nickel transport system substrate-binding protein
MFHGRGRPANQMVSPQVFGFVVGLAPTMPDPEQARALLAQAGYSRGLELAIDHRAGRDIEGLRAQLAGIGIQLQPRPRPWDQLYPRLLAGEVDFYYGSWICSSGDASDLFDTKVHSKDPAAGYGASNSNDYANPELDRWIEASGMTLSMAERRRIFERCMRLLAADLALIPLVAPFQLHGLRHDLEWQPRLDGYLFTAEMRRTRRS